MLEPEQVAAAQAVYPSAGTLRVHPHPEQLLSPEPERPGLNRFDDPDGRVAVRYCATRLIGCFRETLARFRPNPTAEATLASVDGIEPGDLDWDMTDPQPIAEWLAVQRVGTVRVTAVGPIVDIEQDALLVALDKHPRVRAAISVLDRSAHLDVALVRLGGTIGRPVSQALGVAVREWIPDALGIGYRSRLATDEPSPACRSIRPIPNTAMRPDGRHRVRNPASGPVAVGQRGP